MNFFLGRVLQPVSPTAGESGYFSAPAQTLDPSLFNGETIRPDVRAWILDTLYAFWDTKYVGAREWSKVWIAGSGVSYQWAAARGNGDLDILIGVDFSLFWQANPKFNALSDRDMGEVFNQEFHAELWPKTAQQDINGRTFEVTFYVNPNSRDIRDIHPYAAYNLTSDEWTVRPPSGKDFEHPQEYYQSAQREAAEAHLLVDRYNQAVSRVGAPGSPQWHNATALAESLASQASSMYDEIHLGRKQAFGPGGSGYGDYYNFRWQFHKQQGTAQALHAVASAHNDAREAYNQQVYGAAIEGADVMLRRAALWNRGGNGH